MTEPQTTTSSRRTMLTGLGVIVACALACTLPLIAGAGAIAGIGALANGAIGWAVTLLALGGGALFLWRRHAAQDC